MRAAGPFVLLAASVGALLALCVLRSAPMADVLVYRAEGAAVLAGGGDLYGFTVTEWQLPATYPPFAALLFVPTAWVPLGVLKAVFLIGNIGLVVVLVRLSCRFAGLRVTWVGVCAVAALALWLEPVFQTVLFGQINLALACLILWDLTRPPGAPGKGLALGIATGIKLTPAVFIVYLFLAGRRREAAHAVAGFVGTVAVGALVLPGASGEFWTRRLYETGRVGKAWIVDNQSLQGLVARVSHEAEPGLLWAVPAAAVAVAGLYAARAARTPARGVVLAALTALLVSPISWSHHWVWCVPMIAVVWAEGWRRTAWALAALFTSRTMWLLPHHGNLDLHLAWWQQPLASPYPLAGVALLGCAVADAHRTSQPAPGAALPTLPSKAADCPSR
ncbi:MULTISPECIES: glycosyltransferase 87 family protein [unclassified Streptomyces]|uniref:glycosyltransferase 87 family protein n=1 Tax=unclassified Streptomyces TaxID=2593676 RepID=UPI002E18A3BA|nr:MULTISPECIES: glycosyltransferase 87 family protein [unclassified Streptomyces]